MYKSKIEMSIAILLLKIKTLKYYVVMLGLQNLTINHLIIIRKFSMS